MPGSASVRSRALGFVLLAGALAASVAAAEDTPLQRGFANGVTLGVSGQLNMGVQVFDDGRDRVIHAPLDNDMSSSRLGLTASVPRGPWTFEAHFEVEYQPYASDAVSLRDADPDWRINADNIRKLEVTAEREGFGKLWLGQGEMASDGIAEADVSGTAVIAESDHSSIAAGQFFRRRGGGLSGVAIGEAFDNLDGLGRKTRIRYDMPSHHGLGLAVSYGRDVLGNDENDLYDIALTFEQGSERWEVASGIAQAWAADGTEILSGSASALHSPTGLSLTLAAGRADDGSAPGSYGFAKLGWERDLIPAGSTAVSIDRHQGADFVAPDADSRSTGLALVQTVDAWNTELWASLRGYGFSGAGGPFRDATVVYAGARVSF